MGSIAPSLLTFTPVIGNSTVEISSVQAFLGITAAFVEGTGIGPSASWHYTLFASKNGGIYNVVSSSTGPSGISTGGPNGWNVLLTGLTPSTPYSFILTITDPVSGYSTSQAGTLSTTTQAALNYNTVLVASNVTNTSVTITPNSWVPAGNPWSAVTPLLPISYVYAWYRSTTAGVRGSALGGQTSINITDATVSGNITYYYTASISDGTTTVFSTQFAVTTLPNLTNAAPTLVSFNSSTATLTVTSEAGGVPPYARQWYRSTSTGFTPGPGNILTGQTGTTLNDSGLTAATTYYYKYITTDNNSDTTTSAQTSVTTYASMAIAAPTKTSVAATSTVLSVSAATGGSGTYTYAWYVSQTSGFVPSIATLLAGVTSLTPTIDGLSPTTVYYFVVVASDNAGDSVTSTQLAVTTTALLLTVGAIIEEQVSTSSVTLAVLNPMGGAAPYTYAWSRVPAASPALPNTQTITDQTLTGGDSYVYSCTVTDSTSPSPQTANALPITITATPESDLPAYYASQLIYQYQDQPNALATIVAFASGLTLPATSTQTADNILPNVVENAYGIGTATSAGVTATGVQLDILGRYLGVARTITLKSGVTITLSDSEFSQLILVGNRAAQQILTTGNYAGLSVPAQSLAGIDQFLWNFFPNQITVTDSTLMAIGYTIVQGALSLNLINALIAEDLLPKPITVSISYVIVPNPGVTSFFGYSEINEAGTGINPIPLTTTGMNIGVAGQPANTYFIYGTWIDATWDVSL